MFLDGPHDTLESRNSRARTGERYDTPIAASSVVKCWVAESPLDVALSCTRRLAAVSAAKLATNDILFSLPPPSNNNNSREKGISCPQFSDLSFVLVARTI